MFLAVEVRDVSLANGCGALDGCDTGRCCQRGQSGRGGGEGSGSGQSGSRGHSPVGDVRILNGPFKAAQERGHKYLLAFDVDRLLAPFYEQQGEKPKKPRYGGWETGFVPGHMLGHWLSASTRMAQVTGDAELKKRIDYIVSELAALQTRHGDGYVSGLPEKAFNEAFAGHVSGDNGFGGVAVPWYTMHKVYAGLIDAYEISRQ